MSWQKIGENIEQSGALILEENHRHLKREVEEDEDEEEETSGSPMAALEDEEDDDYDTESIIDKTDIPAPTNSFLKFCAAANLPEDVVIGSWELYHHAFQRVSLEGPEKSWQLASIYYFFLSKLVKRHGKASRLFIQPLPVSMLTIAQSFDVSVMELLDKTYRFIEMIHSRKSRRFHDFFRRIQEGLAVTVILFKKFIKVYCSMFVEVKNATDQSPSSHELFTVLWTSFLIMRGRLPVDDLVSNYYMMFSMFDQFYTQMCSLQDGIVHHLNQNFVNNLIDTDSTIIRALCNQFGGGLLDARHFYDHTYKKLPKVGIPSTWDFKQSRKEIIEGTKNAYDECLLLRGNVDERIFIPCVNKFHEIYTDARDFLASNALKKSKSGEEFTEAVFLNKITNRQCLEKLSISQQKTGPERLAQAKEQPRVPLVEFDLDLGAYPEDKNASETQMRVKKIIDGWHLESSKLKEMCEQMCDNPMATLLLKSDEMTQKFEQKLASEIGETREETAMNRYHAGIRRDLEKVFLIYMEKILMNELKKKVREEDLLIVLRREEFLDSVFCFCVELILFSNGYSRAFPWSAKLCNCHPFQFHKIIDLMISHEKRLSRAIVRHFNRIEESVIEYYAWKCDSPLWPMIVRYPLSHFSEFGEDWADKLNTYSPFKFTPLKKPDIDDDDELRDELGRPIVPQNQTSRTLRIFLKRVYFTAARRLQEFGDRIIMNNRQKSQCWSLFDYLIRNEPLILMDRHLDQILLCCVYVVMRLNQSKVTFNEIIAQYRRQAKDATFVYRNVTIHCDQIDDVGNKIPVNTKETVLERIEAPVRPKMTVNLIKYYNVEFRDRIKFIVGQIDTAPDEDLMEMPLPTMYGLVPSRIFLTKTLTIQMLPKTVHADSKQEMVIASMEEHGFPVDLNPGRVSVPADS
ncbi:unnamed protein product [Caenorhabditis sp. 36 PRJEB53466]|nr:unnamed protein product [Caenorhabditis sp. 36 PRJEB53466]